MILNKPPLDLSRKGKWGFMISLLPLTFLNLPLSGGKKSSLGNIQIKKEDVIFCIFSYFGKSGFG